jgi:selenocysteine lyase/cysteine desulfurase
MLRDVDAPSTMPALVGADLEVPLATGGRRRYVNLDAAASTPAMRPVLDAVERALPWYSSVHRGAGFTSQVSTRLYEAARQVVGEFVHARASDSVIFVRNTTDAINHLAAGLRVPDGHVVLSTAVEHHANMLPWRRRAPVVTLPPPPSPEALLEGVAAALRDPARPVAVLAITGASNVTGEVMPLPELGRLAHDHGALLAVDAAQLAPHRRIDMAATGIDCLSLSGHKMYAPFGAGALVAPSALLAECEPLLAGGGAVDFVTLDDVLWTALPDRLEAGSPNVIGAVALGAAAATLADVGMDRVAEHERKLLAHAERRLADLPGLLRHRLWEDRGVDRLGVLTVTVPGMHHALVAAALSAEHAIGVRHGCFCAHPYITHLLGISGAEALVIRDALRRGERAAVPGALRASFSIATTIADVDAFCDALASVMRDGPALAYEQDPATGDFFPRDDRRVLPRIEPLPELTATVHGAGCGQF